MNTIRKDSPKYQFMHKNLKYQYIKFHYIYTYKVPKKMSNIYIFLTKKYLIKRQTLFLSKIKKNFVSADPRCPKCGSPIVRRYRTGIPRRIIRIARLCTAANSVHRRDASSFRPQVSEAWIRAPRSCATPCSLSYEFTVYLRISRSGLTRRGDVKNRLGTRTRMEAL